MITISKEDYLKAIAEAEAEGQTVIPATLAHWLSVTRPAVTFALKRLRKDGLVSIKKEGQICLTSQGREIAERTMVRHHLIERMLADVPTPAGPMPHQIGAELVQITSFRQVAMPVAQDGGAKVYR
jgi:Mn-dependent DtxR family transcriptional regulator